MRLPIPGLAWPCRQGPCHALPSLPWWPLTSTPGFALRRVSCHTRPHCPCLWGRAGDDEGLCRIGQSNEHQALWMAGAGEQGHRGRDAHELIAQCLQQLLGRKDLGPCIESVFCIKTSLGKIQKG